jgi:hypothetical protein
MILNMQFTGNAINPEKNEILNTVRIIMHGIQDYLLCSMKNYYDITLGKANLITKN